MKREEYWGTNSELLVFLDLIRLNVNIYTSLDQDVPEFRINYVQNTGKINIKNAGDIIKAWSCQIDKIRFR